MNTDTFLAVAIVALVVTMLGLLVGSIFYSASKTAECRASAMQAHYQATDIAIICK